MEFSGNTIIKFCDFIYMCNKIFKKTGVIMTLREDSNIRVAPDPYDIQHSSFNHNECAVDSIKAYKHLTFVEYPLIKASENSSKNATYNKLELEIANLNLIGNGNKIEHKNEDKLVSFRIELKQLKDLNDKLQDFFLNRETITLKAEPLGKSDKGYPNACLSLISKTQKDSLKSFIYFKPIKKYYKITDYEDEVETQNGENQLLGKYLSSCTANTMQMKKFLMLTRDNFCKLINLYLYKENDKKEKTIKSHLFFSYLSNYLYFGEYINNEKIDSEEFEIIYNIKVNAEMLIKILENFNYNPNNLDYISVYSKGLIFKANFKEKNNEENKIQNSQNDENIEEKRDYMIVKTLYLLDRNIEILNFKGIDIDDGWAKKKYVLKIIKNDIDEKHEELNNNSFDSNYIDDEVNNSLIDEDEDEDEEDISEIIEKKMEEKKKRKSFLKKND